MQNVLLVTIDSLRADHVGCYGYDRETTPNIDRYAEDGARFSNAFAHACSTRPSFPAILTSSHALMYGGYERVSDARTVVSEVFDDAGYRTAGFHSNLYLGADFGYDRGFDTFFDSKTDPSPSARIRQFVKDRLDSDGALYRTLADAFDAMERHAGANIGSTYVRAEEITEMAIDWIRSTDDRPSFLWVHYMDVHHPYVPPDEHQYAFREEPISERRAIKLRRKMLETPGEVTEDDLSEIIDLYDAEIRYTDAEIGRLLNVARDAWTDPAIAITADHGEEFLDHGSFSHHATFYDEVLHVPLILRDDERRGTYDDLVGLLDVSPTLVGGAGLEIPENFHGRSLYPLLDHGEWDRDAVIGDWSNGERRFAYRDHRWKYIRTVTGEELYDLEANPNETENLVDEYPEVRDRLRETIEEHERAVDETHVDLGEVEMDEEVRQRLRDLGYQE